MEQDEERTQNGQEKCWVASSLCGLWSQAKTTGEVRGMTDTWRCERSSIVVMVLGKLVVWIFVKLYV